MRPGEQYNFNISNEELNEAINHARREQFIDNLRVRNIFVQLDSKVRGYLGEIKMNQFFAENSINVLGVDAIDNEDAIDRDFVIQMFDGSSAIIECKTSLVPDIWTTIDDVIEKGDIKIIKREQDYHDIPIDIHVQIYFNQYRRKRDSMLSQLQGTPEDYTNEELINLMGLSSLRQSFFAWMDRESLNSYLKNSPQKTWSYGMRQFWSCPLKYSKKATDLARFIHGELF